MSLKRGRPKRMSFSGLFLPSLEWELSIEEQPMREFEEHPTAGTLFRNVRRFASVGDQRKALAKAASVIGQMPPSPLRDDLLTALAGDQDAEQRVAALGPWRMFLAGAGPSSSVYLAKEFTRVETLCVAADEALGRCDLAGAAKAVAQQPEAVAFWRHGSLEQLASSTTLEQSLIPRLVAYLELQMSCVAMASALESRSVLAGEELVRRLLVGRRRPGANFMRYLLDVVGARTQAELLNFAAGHLGDGEALPSEATTKRWFSGAVFPPAARIRPLALAVARGSKSSAAEGELRLLFWCARRANSAMVWAAMLHERVGASRVLGAEDIHQWAEAAYGHWMTRWRNRSTSESARPI